jgi:hypothetical protein
VKRKRKSAGVTDVLSELLLKSVMPGVLTASSSTRPSGTGLRLSEERRPTLRRVAPRTTPWENECVGTSHAVLGAELRNGQILFSLARLRF